MKLKDAKKFKPGFIEAIAGLDDVDMPVAVACEVAAANRDALFAEALAAGEAVAKNETQVLFLDRDTGKAIKTFTFRGKRQVDTGLKDPKGRAIYRVE